MRKATWLAFFSVFMLLGSNLLADDVAPKINFEGGAEVETVIKNFRRLFPISKTALRTSKRAPGLAETSADDKGRVIGVDLIARIHDSEPYNEALKYPPLIEDLPPTVRDPLKADWAAINATRSELIGDANSLEKEDAQLYQEAVEIDRNADVLNRRKAQLEAEVDQFNRSCTGRPLPPDEYNRCLAWRNDLTGRINQYNADVDAHNNRFDAWRTRALDLKRRAGTASKQRKAPPTPTNPFLVQVRSWELNNVNPFINRAKEALAAACGKLKKIEIDPREPQVLEAGGEKLPFRVHVEHEAPQDKPCPVTYKWELRHNEGNIGTISPQDKKDAVLTPGNKAAKGSVMVEVRDSRSNVTLSQATRVDVLESGLTSVIFQAQGGDIGAGKYVNVTVPLAYLCVELGEQGLMELRQILTDSEYRQRDQAIIEAGVWMRRVASTGGLVGRLPPRSFYNAQPNPANARIDIEIWRGRAFVNCPAKGAK